MKEPNKANIDQVIREALDQKDADAILNASSDPTLFEMISNTFRTRMRWIVGLAVLMTFVYSAVMVYCVVRFSHANDLKLAMTWGGGAVICLIIVVAHKIWFWIEMSRISHHRELKRLELQVAALAERMSQGS